MYNLRYHIASLVAVFLALAMGLFLGAMIVDSGAVDRTSASVIESLQKEYDSLRTENARLDDEVADGAAFESTLVGEWADGRLVDSTVLLVAGPEPAAGESLLVDALEAAGADIAYLRLTETSLTVPAALDILSRVGDEALPDGDSALPALADTIVSELGDPDSDRPAISALVDDGLLAIEGLEPGIEPTSVIDTTFGEAGTEGFGLTLAESAARSDVRTFVAVHPPVDETTLAEQASVGGLTVLNGLEGSRATYSIVSLASRSMRVGVYGFTDDGRYIVPTP